MNENQGSQPPFRELKVAKRRIKRAAVVTLCAAALYCVIVLSK